jgi:hypothetical protein
MTATSAHDRYEQTLITNAEAANELVVAAAQLSHVEWTTPTRAGGWTPAQHVVHVALAYRNAVADVRDGRRAKLLGTPLRRQVWRVVGLTQVLWLHFLPAGIASPDELIPPSEARPREAVVAELIESVAEFDAAMRDAHLTRPDYRLAHPYFDKISLRSTAILCAVHTRHHAKLLRRLARAVSDRTD